MIGFVRRDTACRVRRFRERNIPLETFHRNVFKIKKQQAGHKGGAVLFAPPSKSCRFSHPPSPCARSMAQGVSLSADSDSEGYSPSKNTSPAALSWSSLFGQTVLKLFCFRTTRFVFHRKAGTQCAVSDHSCKKKHSHRSESAFLVVPCTMAIPCPPASPVQRLPLVR